MLKKKKKTERKMGSKARTEPEPSLTDSTRTNAS